MIQNAIAGLDWPRVRIAGRDKDVFCLSGAVNVSIDQIREVFVKLNYQINVCSVVLTNIDDGRDFILFELKSNDKKIKNNLEIYKNEFLNLIKFISIDFCDVVYHGLVDVKISLKYCEEKRHSGKTLIKIIDHRNYVR